VKLKECDVKIKIRNLKFTIIIYFLLLFCTDVFCHPKRIISLGPAITEQLYLLGVGDKIIANTIYCTRPPDAEKKEKIGTVVEHNIEKITALKPDLVIASSLTNPKTLNKLRNLGIKTIQFSYAKNFNEVCAQFLELGKVVGKAKEAKSIIMKAKSRIDSIRRKTKKLPQVKVFIQIGAKPLFTAPKDTFVNDFIELAGGINIAKEANSGLYSREKVIEQNPDVIVITTMGIVGEEEKKIWKKYKTINAVKNDRIYIIDSYKLCSPTPVSFVETLQEILKILHKK
ncbi:MAG: ABC transporter substrate-binding protein, partial [Elusimicrobiota bacterium]|nr:ABC transporter substrate-binding protein [Elusimicrobiota bacterium]